MLRFTLRQIQYFVAVGETGNITLAAERIAISPPSISTAIAHLETELGTKLFVRHHAQGLSLTAVGKTLLVEAKALLAQAEHIVEVASEVTGSVRGQINAGCFLTLAPLIMPELAHTFTNTHPDAKVAHFVSDHAQLLDALIASRIDVALLYDLGVPQGVRFTPLARLPAHAVVGEGHPLAGRASVTVEELAGEDFILLDLPASRDYFLDLFRRAGLEPRISWRSAYPDVIRTMVANDYGFTISNVTPRTDYALDGRRVVRVPIAGEHPPMVIGLATVEDRRPTTLTSAFMDVCGELISDDAIPGMIAPGQDLRAMAGE